MKFSFLVFGLLALGLFSNHCVGQEALKVGDKAPDFELEGLGDEKIKLSERFGEKGRPVILLFSRANW